MVFVLAFSFALLASCQKDPDKTDSMAKESHKYFSTLSGALAEVNSMVANGTPCIKVEREDRVPLATITGSSGSPSTCYWVHGNDTCADGSCDCYN